MSVFAGLSLKEIYVKRCRDLRCKTNSAVRQTLPSDPDDFESLNHLDVSRNFLGPRGVLPLLDVIRCSRQLHSVDLRDQRLEYDAIEAICCAVQRHPSLVRLNLSNNPINIAAGGLLLELARTNPTLEYILLEDTAVKDTMLTAIAKQLSDNREAKAFKAQAHLESQTLRTVDVASATAKERMSPQAVQRCLGYFPASVCSLLFDENPLDLLVKHCRDNSCWFNDIQFSAADDTVQKLATEHYNIHGWTRLAELYPSAQLFPSCADSRDGVYDLPVMSLPGFQWLFTSVVAAAPTVAHLRQMLLSEDGTADARAAALSCGVYTLRLFIDGAWRYVIVDDFVPVDRAGQPIFSPAVHARDGQTYIWSCLLEKAFAKLHGGYQAIDSDLVRDEAANKVKHTKPGRPEKAATDPMTTDRHTNCFKTMSDLSGGIGLVQPLHTDTFRAEKWWPVMYEMLSKRPHPDAEAPWNQGSSPVLRGPPQTDTAIANGSAANKQPQTPGTTPLPPMAVAVSRESAKTLPGIQPHHAYQVIQVVQLNGFSLVELANVCECKDVATRWRGEWSEESPLWSRHPDVDLALRSKQSAAPQPPASPSATAAAATSTGPPSRKRSEEQFTQKIIFGHSSSPRASFWMSYVDFLQAFEELHCARSFPGTSSGQVEGSWGRHSAGGPLSADTWYTNPHYRVSVAEKGTAFICLGLPDRRFTASEVGAIGFHWVKDELYPIYDPHSCGGPQTEASRFLYRAKYVKTDSICFETKLEATEDYWFVPSTLCPGQMHRFIVRVFCSVPFVLTHEALAEHWSVATVEDQVLSSGAFRSGDDNAQVAFRLDDVSRSMHSMGGTSLSATSSVSASRQSHLSRTAQSNFMNSVIGSISVDSYSRAGGSSAPTGYFIARAVVVPAATPATPQRNGGDGTERRSSRPGSDAPNAEGKVSLGLFLAFADQNPAGELSRTVGMLTDDNWVAESPYVLGNRVHCEGPVTAAEAYTLICCVQPIETRARVNITLFTTIPTCKLAVLPAWPKQSVEVQWRQSGSYYEADNQPQVEIFPARSGARFVVHMCMLEYSCAQATITLSVLRNDGRKGMALIGKIPQERILGRSEYVRDNWVQCSVEIGDTDLESIIAIPCLQPTGSRGTCVVSISSDTEDFGIRVLQGATAKKASTKR